MPEKMGAGHGNSGALKLKPLLDLVQMQGEPGFFPARASLGDGACLCCLVQGRCDILQRNGGFGLLALGGELGIFLLEGMQAGGHAAVADLLARTVAHTAFGGLGIRHKLVFYQFRAGNSSQLADNVNGLFCPVGIPNAP